MRDEPTQKKLLKKINELESLEMEHKLAFEWLKESEGNYRSIVENIPGITYRCALDKEWTMFIMNEYTEQVTGYAPSDFINNAVRSYDSIIHSEDREYVNRIVNEGVQSRQPWEIEYRIIHKDGRILWVHEKGNSVSSPDGKVQYLEGVILDITNRKKGEGVRNRNLARQQHINKLQEYLLGAGSLSRKIKSITDGVIEAFSADFCRIWIVRPADLCKHGCVQGQVDTGPNICKVRDRCLHLVASSGRYTNVDGGHKRVPIGAYKIGRLAVGPHSKFLSNNVTEDPHIHDHKWAGELGLKSFAGYQLRDVNGETVGVLALFSKHVIEPEDDILLENLGNSTAQVIQTSMAEDSLKESEEKYRKIFNNEIDAISIFDIETRRILDVNDAFLKLYGYSREEALQLTTDDVSDEPEESKNSINQVAIEGDTLIPIRYHKAKDGTPITVEISAGPFTWKGQNVMYAVMRDISEHIKAKEALSRSEERYRNLFNYSNDGIYVHDLDGNIIEMNQKALEQSGLTREEILTSKVFDILAPESHHKIEQLLQEIPKKDFINFEMVGKNNIGDFFPIELSASLLDLEGEKYVQSVVRDVSERKKLEEELLKVQKLESTGVLAGGIAHDFNNLLMSILGNISLAKLYYKKNKNQVLEKLNDAEKAISRSQDLTQQLLTFSKGGEPVKKAAVVANVLRESISFALSGSNVKSELSIAENIWPIMVDEGQIGQVIQNVIKNADQAMPDGGTVTICTVNKEINQKDALPLDDGKYVEIVISDTGVGILEKNLPKVFDPYFSTKKGGSGLGLAGAYSIIKNHQGFITVNSKPGKGTTFQIYLPVSEEIPVSPHIAEDKPLVGGGKVLIMDDEEPVLTVAVEMLEFLDYSVEAAQDGNEAISLYQKAIEDNRPFDAVMLDLTIPGGMGGKETMQKLKEIDPDVKAIVSSGYANDPIMADYANSGFCGVVAKPYNIQSLRDVLDQVLEKKTSCS